MIFYPPADSMDTVENLFGFHDEEDPHTLGNGIGNFYDQIGESEKQDSPNSCNSNLSSHPANNIIALQPESQTFDTPETLIHDHNPKTSSDPVKLLPEQEVSAKGDFLGGDEQFQKDFFDWINNQSQSPKILSNDRNPLMTRANSHTSSIGGGTQSPLIFGSRHSAVPHSQLLPRSGSPTDIASKTLLTREDSLNELMRVIESDTQGQLQRPTQLATHSNRTAKNSQEDIQHVLNYLTTNSNQSSPINALPPSSFPTITSSLEESGRTTPAHSVSSHSRGPMTISDVGSSYSQADAAAGLINAETEVCAAPPSNSHHNYTTPSVGGTGNVSKSQLQLKFHSPKPKSNLSWTTPIGGIRIKVEPQDFMGSEKNNYVFLNTDPADNHEQSTSTSRPSSVDAGVFQVQRPVPASSLPPQFVDAYSQDSPSCTPPPLASTDKPGKASGGRKNAVKKTPVPRKRKPKLEMDTFSNASEDPEETEDIKYELLPPPRKYTRRSDLDDPQEFMDWRTRRDRNNDAVRRARAKKKQREMEIEQRCEALEDEVERLKRELALERKKTRDVMDLLNKQQANQRGIRKLK